MCGKNDIHSTIHWTKHLTTYTPIHSVHSLTIPFEKAQREENILNPILFIF